MDHSNFPEKVKNWLSVIKENAAIDSKKTAEYCRKLEGYANEVHSDYLKGFSLYYRGLSYYVNSKLEKSMTYMSDALNRLITAEAWELVAKSYNAMGNIADFQGDVSLAIDCYMKGLLVSKEHGIASAEHSLGSNIANIYLSLNEFASAVNILLDCERMSEQGLNTSVSSRAIVNANLCFCYIQMDELDKAVHHLEILKELTNGNSTTDNMDELSVNILEARLFHKLGEFEKRNDAIARLNAQEFSSMNIFDALNELGLHAMLLLEIGKIDEFLDLVKQFETLAHNPIVEKEILELRLNYYKKIGDKENQAKVALRYFEVAKLREEEHNKIIGHNIQTRIHLEEEAARRKEVEISNLMLKQKSEHDALTGMNNRYKLNELAELAFHRAYLNGSPLTIEILDIDCYKEFNDNYGHQAGDDCLIKLADIIRSMEDYAGVHTARYGGDEFVIIYEDYTKSDVEKMARKLHDMIYRANIEHKYSKVSDRVTISQGLFHKIPSGGNKTWDFLYGADMALYGVKNRTKNGYYIGTTFDEVRAYSKGNTKTTP